MDKVNLHLLATFSEIYRTRSVSKASQNLGMSQPGISAALGRLRRHFGDRLFVRTSTGMEPTPHAQQLIHLVDPALEQVRRALGYQAAFHPEASTRHFTVCTTDISQLLLLPLWLERRGKEAPNISIEIVRVSEASSRALESGQIDLAVGFFPEARAGLHEQTMDEQGFACVASVRHPRIGHTLSLAQFQTEPTVVIDCLGSGSQYAEMVLRQRKVDRNVVIKVPDFLGVESMIESTDMIATMPTPIAVFFAKNGLVKLLDLPLPIPPYTPRARWHERFHLDPANQWLRRIVTDIWLGIVRGNQRR
ncbi:MAG: LysR family transcriptional regulator [Burkholderiales bacterium]